MTTCYTKQLCLAQRRSRARLLTQLTARKLHHVERDAPDLSALQHQGHCCAGGLAIANELTTKTEFLTLTFGLTDGWWLFEDADRRMPGAPLLSRFDRFRPVHLYTCERKYVL